MRPVAGEGQRRAGGPLGLVVDRVVDHVLADARLAAAVKGHDRRQADELGRELEREDLELVALDAEGQAGDALVGRAHAPGG